LHLDENRKVDEVNRYFGLALLLAFFGAAIHLIADEAITITVRPAVTVAHGNAQLKVILDRNEMNRSLIWEVDGPNYYRSSAMELAGASAPRSYFFLVKDLPEGNFEVRATVRRNDNSQAVDRSRIIVVGKQ
jgi:hypothetical protein